MKMYDFIFSRSWPLRIYRHILFWAVLYVFSFITYFHPFFETAGLSRWLILQTEEVFLHIITQMAFCYTILYYLIPRFFNQKKYAAFTVWMFALIAVTVLIYFEEHAILFKKLHDDAGMPFMPANIVLWFTVISFITYFARTTALVLTIHTLKNWYMKQQENQLLLVENASAELQLLKAQIHPHFLFNTLNNIYSFTLNKNPKSPMLVKKLSGTLHYMVNDCEAPLVSLKEELDMISDYMELEKIRYGNRLQMEIAITGFVANKMITPLLLIPFIENSFKHGTSQVLQAPWIKLQIDVKDDFLQFHLSNSKPLTKAVSTPKSGIGLNNVKKRLQLLYPSRYRLNIESSVTSFFVELQLPLEKVFNNADSLEPTIHQL